MSGAQQTPLLELLDNVPDGAHSFEITPTHHQHVPYGRLCREAAVEIRRLEAAIAADRAKHDDEFSKWVIEVETMLCAALGRPWTAAGISIESLIKELADRAKREPVLLPTMPDGPDLDDYFGNPEILAGLARAHRASLVRGLAARLLAALPVRDWIEDFSHENGNYECECGDCGNRFTGHKRRIQCKACATLPVQQAPAGWRAAIQSVRERYPTDIFPEGDSLTAKSAKMARITCDNIEREIEELETEPEAWQDFRECRHCGFEWRPNANPSKRGYILGPPQEQARVPEGWEITKHEYGEIHVKSPGGSFMCINKRGGGGMEALAYELAEFLAVAPTPPGEAG